jgi:hypothetical protein
MGPRLGCDRRGCRRPKRRPVRAPVGPSRRAGTPAPLRLVPGTPWHPYRCAALQLGKAPNRLYIYGRLRSQAPGGPGHPARQPVTVTRPHRRPRPGTGVPSLSPSPTRSPGPTGRAQGPESLPSGPGPGPGPRCNVDSISKMWAQYL